MRANLYSEAKAPFLPRRRSKRVLANDVAVRDNLGPAEGYELCFLRDIGEGGVFLRTKKLLPLGSPISVELSIEGGRELEPSGTVVYTVNPDDIASPKPTG